MIPIPSELAACHERHSGRAWIGALPGLAASMLERWDLTWDHSVDGPPRHGMVALVLPVRRPDGSPAALKLQPVDDESAGEPLGF